MADRTEDRPAATLQQLLRSGSRRLRAGWCACLLVGLLGVCPAWIPAAEIESIGQEYVLRVWERENGFPDIAATAFAQTRDGYLWIGTFSGLFRFDGQRFVQIAPEVTPALADDAMVLRLLVDHDGTLWVGSSKGIARLRDGAWRTFGTESGYPGGRVWSMADRGDGIVVSVEHSLFAIARDRVEALPALPLPPGEPREMQCAVDGAGAVWAMTLAGLYRLDRGGWTVIERSSADLGNAYVGVKSARDGGIWLADSGRIRLWREGAWRRAIDRPEGFRADALTMLEDSQGALWAGGYTHGVIRSTLDGRTQRAAIADGLENDSTLVLFEDNEQNVWIGTNGGGIACLRPRSFTTYDDKAGTPQPVMNSLVELAPGSFLVATHGAGVLTFARGRFGGSIPMQSQPGAINEWPRALVKDAGGVVWMGGYRDGLYRLEGDRFEPEALCGEAVSDIFGLYADVQNRLWIGLAGGVACREGGQIRIYGRTEGLPDGTFHAFALDREGTLWAGSRRAGLFQLAAGQPAFRPVKPEGALGEALTRVSALYLDRSGVLWIGCEEGPLVRVDHGRMFLYDGRSGLPAWRWSGIIEDLQGDLWIGASDGIARLRRSGLDEVAAGRRERLELLTFDQGDGLRSASCRTGFQPVCLRAADGRLWFATLKGLAVVDPTRVRVAPQPPPTWIEEVTADGQTLLPAPKGKPVAVPAGTRRLAIRYTGISLGAAGRVEFSCRLYGLDWDWINRGGGRVAEFQDLEPGNYVFHVRARNREGQETPDGARLAFVVAPFFWQTSSFRIAVLVVLLGGIGGGIWTVMQARYQRQRERLEQERALLRERARADAARAAQAAADAASRAKSEFLTTISHEIRTPLNGVVGPLELLGETPLTPAQQDLIGTARASAETLLAIIGDILDLSKIEAGKMVLEHGHFDLRQPVVNVLSILAARAAQQQVELVLDFAADVPTLVQGDSARLRQALLNLVANAVKFTPRGHVVVRVERVAEPPRREGHVSVRVVVRDTGIGIPPEVVPRLFEKFTQGDSSITRRFGGTGLGLAISRRLVDLMGGEIGLESEPDRGSTFWIIVPLVVEDAPPPPPPLVPPGLRVLLVDDLDESRRALSESLKTLQIEHAVASTVAEARRLVVASDGTVQQIVLLDQSVVTAEPEALRKYLAQEQAWQAAKLVLLSDPACPQEVPADLSARFEARIDKPVLLIEQLVAAFFAVRKRPSNGAG